MAKDRSYGDRGTGYTPRIESVPGTKNEKKQDEEQDPIDKEEQEKEPDNKNKKKDKTGKQISKSGMAHQVILHKAF